jgi:hypothetical protein
MDIRKDLKPTLLLALAFFMATAPNPDSAVIAEMTANFIVPKHEYPLQAAELANRPEEAPVSEYTTD